MGGSIKRNQARNFSITPHIGASIANIVDAVPGASKHIKLLGNETGMLEDLNKAFRKFCAAQEDHVTKIYYEKHTTYKSVLVVTRESADPEIPGANPVAVDRDHISICKPKDRDDVVYLGIKRHIEKTQNGAGSSSGAMAFSTYSEESERDRRDLLQKLNDADREAELEPRPVCRRLQLMSRMEHHEQDNKQVYARGPRTSGPDVFLRRAAVRRKH